MQKPFWGSADMVVIASFFAGFGRIPFRNFCSGVLLLFAALPCLAQTPVTAAVMQEFKQAPTFAEAFLNLGLVREEQGRHEEAIADFQKALQLKPRLRGANLFLGIAEYRTNKLDASVAALRKETTSSPKDANAWMWLGIVALEKGDGDEAVQALDQAAKLSPDNVDILYHRGRAHLYVSQGSYARMYKADPKSWRVRQVLAQANAEAERHLDALAEYQEAIRLAPNQ